MSTTTRPPLLSDDAILEAFTFGPSIRDAMHGYLSGANMVRDIYENLITDAKLRVVEEVELVRDGSVDDGQGGTIPLYVHKNCLGPYHEICGYEDSDEVDATYCPGCGGKIKRHALAAKALAELDKAQQPGKVLTDEEAYEAACKAYNDYSADEAPLTWGQYLRACLNEKLNSKNQ